MLRPRHSTLYIPPEFLRLIKIRPRSLLATLQCNDLLNHHLKTYMSPQAQNNCPVTIIALPNETLCTIFNDFAPPTLAIIACLSHRFKDVAERLLYSSISLTETVSQEHPSPEMTLQWCHSMRRRAHLIDAIKKLHIRWQADTLDFPTHHLSTACLKVADVLRPLIYLESLEIFLGPANMAPAHGMDPMHAIERVIARCQFPLLRHCSLGADWTKGVQPYTGVLTTFLASLPSLRHLKLPSDHHALDLPADAIPNLSTFRGSADTAAFLLPGRPVQALSLIGRDSDVNRENLGRMTYTTVPLRYLDLSAMSVRPVLVRNISTHLPNLEVLRIKLALRHTLHYAFSGIRLLSGLSAVLSAFQQLSFIDLGPTDVDGVGRRDVKEEVTLCHEWRRACPHLRRVIFPSETEWLFQDSGDWLLVQD